MMEYAKNSCVLNFWEWEVGRGKFYDEISTSIIFDLLIILIKLSHCKLSTVNLQLRKTHPQPLSSGEFTIYTMN
jgi:hypothetical protein